jgi:site-specific recombinase XerD
MNPTPVIPKHAWREGLDLNSQHFAGSNRVSNEVRAGEQMLALVSSELTRENKRHDHAAKATSIPVSSLTALAEEYLWDCELRLHSPRTLETRRVFIRNLLWFLNHRSYTICGTSELRHFFHYLAHGHQEVRGRFGNPHLTRPLRPVTIKDYYICLRSLFSWVVAQGYPGQTPFHNIPKPQVRDETKQPLTAQQIDALLQAAEGSKSPERDKALIYFLLDTGCRASELVAISQCNLDLHNQSCSVVGKGNKHRTVYFGTRTTTALQTYLVATQERRAETQNPEGLPLFLSRSGTTPFTRSGLLQLLERLTLRAGIRTSCPPHAFRRTFAVQTLKNGANVFSVQAMLGHSDLEMTRRYCALAQADVEAQHRAFSPVDHW